MATPKVFAGPDYFGVVDLNVHGKWVALTNCRYLPNPANDGDSFHVAAGNKKYLFRLYFVDAEEFFHPEGAAQKVAAATSATNESNKTDSFDAFFHPQRGAQTATTPITRSTSSPAAAISAPPTNAADGS
jgi:hypothetical protein